MVDGDCAARLARAGRLAWQWLLGILLLAPGGIAELLDRASRRPLHTDRNVTPRIMLLRDLLLGRHREDVLTLVGVELSFGAVRAIDGLALLLHPGEVHGLIGPNGRGKTTTRNAISGFVRPQRSLVRVGADPLPPASPVPRAAAGIARTFQTPKLAGEASVLDNVLLGGHRAGAFRRSYAALKRLYPEGEPINRHVQCLVGAPNQNRDGWIYLAGGG